MANIKIPRKTFEKEIGKLDDKMKERIALFGTPLESVSKDEIEIEIFPNRPDLLSYQGFKRGFQAFLGKKTGLKKYNIRKPDKNYYVKVDSSVRDVRPYTVCAIVRGLRLNDEKIKEIIEIQEKLHSTIGRRRKKLAIGIYPLEKIKLPIYYEALEPDKIRFQPLESPREMSGLEILQRHPTGKEYAHLLKGKIKFPIFRDAERKILSMPPIINSELTGRITEKTREVFIECSGFDLLILKKCLNIIITAFSDMGGKVYSMKIKSKESLVTPDLSTEKMKISLANVNKLLGLELTEKQMKSFLEKMGHNYDFKKKEVEIASWRTDILHEVDLIEEVAVAYGYENFVPLIPDISSIGNENFREIAKRKMSEILSGMGILEVSNFYLTNRRNQYENMGISEKKEGEILSVSESKTEYDILRENLSHYLLKNLSGNIDSEYPQKIFEIGKVFENAGSGKGIKEKERLSVAMTPGNFTDLRQILENFSKMLGIKIDIKESDEKSSFLVEGRIGNLMFKGKKIGQVGEVHPKILKNWKIKMPVAILEMGLEEIFESL